MITTATPVEQLGFSLNPINAVKAVARTAAKVVTNPNVQRAAVTAANVYAPTQYAQAAAAANKAQTVYRTIIGPNGQPVQVPAQPIQVPMQMPAAPAISATDASDMHPAKSGGMITFALIGAGLLAVLLIAKK